MSEATGPDVKDVEVACADARHNERQLMTYYLFLFGVQTLSWKFGAETLAGPGAAEKREGLIALHLGFLFVFSHLWALFAASTLVAARAIDSQASRFPVSRTLYMGGGGWIGGRLFIIAGLPFGLLGFLGVGLLETCRWKAGYVGAIAALFLMGVFPSILALHGVLSRALPKSNDVRRDGASVPPAA